MKDKYKSYEESLNLLELESLQERRKILCLKFAKKCLNNQKMKHFFKVNEKDHTMKTRNAEKFKVDKFKTERMRNSPIVYMQQLLNNQPMT